MSRSVSAIWHGLRLRSQITVILSAAAVLIAATSMAVEAIAFERRAERRQYVISRVFSQAVFSILDGAPVAARADLVANMSGPYRSVSISQPEPLLTDDVDTANADELARLLDHSGFEGVKVYVARSSRRNETGLGLDEPGPVVVEIYTSMRAEDTDGWIIATTRFAPPSTRRPLAATLLAQMVITLGLLTLVLVILRRLTAPVDRLARAADRMSHGDSVAPIAETGARDIRTMISMFNRMTLSLSQTIAYQKTLLQSLGHDLKSPLRDARRSAAQLGDPDDRAAMSERLDGLEAQLASITSFTRATLRDGDVENIELGALLDALIEEAEERDHPVTAALPEGRVIIRGRHHALARALRNLIENAVRYGGNADVTLRTHGASAEITIDDNGPGVSDTDLERLFQPFVRLATDTQGTGLGLAIARTVILDHGGTLTLDNRATGGLRQTVRLPLAQVSP